MNRYFWSFLTLCSVLLASCSPLAVPPAETPTLAATAMPPTNPPPTPETTPITGTSTADMLPPAVNAAVDFLVKALNLPDKSTLTVKSFEKVEWADGCLELGGPAEACMMMIVPGYRVIVTDTKAKMEYELHTDESGASVRQAPPVEMAAVPVLKFMRTGGIAGVCQRLTVDSKGYYLLVSCNKVDTVLGAGQLPEAEWAMVQAWQSQYASFSWQTPPQPGADMFMDSLTFVGEGAESVSEEAQAQVLKTLDEWWTTLPRTTTSDFMDSGVAGVVLISPACPGPQTDDPACADKPYPLQFTVTDLTTEAVLAEVHTGEDGQFRVALPPGGYRLNPILTARFPTGEPVEVKVEAGVFTTVTVMLDSGLR